MPLTQPAVLRDALLMIRPFWPIAAFATAAGALGGLASAWLLATINAGLHAQQGFTLPLALRFACFCALSVGGGAAAGVGNSLVGQKMIASLRKDVSARILRAPMATIERRRSHRLMAVLTSDVDTVSAFTFSFSGYAVAFAVALGGFLYLLWLSPLVFVLSVVANGLGVAVSFYSKRTWIRNYEGVREAQDDLHKQYRAIIAGAKELRINRQRRAHIHGLLLSGAADRIADLKIQAMSRVWIADSIGAAIFFVVIGLLLSLRRPLNIDASVISGAVLVLLYVKGPIDQLVMALPLFGQAQVSFLRIAALTQDFREPDLSLDRQDERSTEAVRSIELRNARYAFEDAEPERKGFALGPINLRIEAGETLFIVGENGSGKTTLIKLLLGLYRPTSGALLFNGKPVSDLELDPYRQLFSAVFSDYFLFEDLLQEGRVLPVTAAEYLKRLDVADKVRIESGRFSTIDLSTGQRKRLALVHAYLEDRPIMMFDEWAADQDPTFRSIYYTELLPELKAWGKTLIVVSHDDRYFETADRIIRLDNGRIVEDKRPGSRACAGGAIPAPIAQS
jgi:putative ATP-binding cassette transporter